MFSAPTPQVLGVQHTAVVAPSMDASLEIGMFPRLTTGPIMTSDQHELFSKFLKLKPPVFKGAESEDAYDFLVDCHELLHKMGIVERFGVEFVTYQFQGNTKMWWRSYVECQPAQAPPMTWASFSILFIEKPCSQPRKRAYFHGGIHARSHSSCMLYSRNLRCWCRKHWRCLP